MRCVADGVEPGSASEDSVLGVALCALVCEVADAAGDWAGGVARDVRRGTGGGAIAGDSAGDAFAGDVCDAALTGEGISNGHNACGTIQGNGLDCDLGEAFSVVDVAAVDTLRSGIPLDAGGVSRKELFASPALAFPGEPDTVRNER